MIVTRSWLNEWIDLDGISTEEIVKTFNSIGLEVDRVHTYMVPKKIVFGRVLECEKHPDADKLNVCQVDLGGTVCQIVCGASNVRAGLDVVVATVGAVMPNGMLIKPVKLRGIASDGMICSAKEIGLEDCQNGILELDDSIGKFTLGQEVSENSYLNDDLIEIELTANRGDCLSIRGVARDLSAAFNRPIKEQDIHNKDDKRGVGRILSFSHEKSLDISLRYKAVDLKTLAVPLLLKLRLAQIDEKRDSDIESIMAYATHSTGVILTVYNYSFFLENGDSPAKIRLLEDENGYASIFANQRASVVGVLQDKVSNVSYDEGIAIVEASYIPPEIISKKMSLNKIKSDSIFYKTSRGSEPELDIGLFYAIKLIESISTSSTYGGTIELEHSYKDKIVSVSIQEIDEIIGTNVDKMLVNNILKNLGFDITKSSIDKFVISVPKFRHDIVNKQDIIEEIVRMIGIDNIPSKPLIFTERNRLQSNYFEYKKRTIFRHRSAQSGFFESIHFMFDEKEVLNNYGFETTKDELELLNPIVKTLDTLRPTLLTGLLKAASANYKNGYSSIRLFEIGSVFSPLREESTNLALLFSGFKEADSLSNGGKPNRVDFAFFTQKIADIIGEFELEAYETLHKLSHDYQCAKILVNGERIGEVFKLHPNIQKDYDLDDTYLCEIEFNKIPYNLKTAISKSKYQASFRDLSILVPKRITYSEIKSVIESNASDELIRFYPVDRYEDESLQDSVSLSIRFVLQSNDKTLEEDDINNSMDKILDSLKDRLGIELR